MALPCTCLTKGAPRHGGEGRSLGWGEAPCAQAGLQERARYDWVLRGLSEAAMEGKGTGRRLAATFLPFKQTPPAGWLSDAQGFDTNPLQSCHFAFIPCLPPRAQLQRRNGASNNSCRHVEQRCCHSAFPPRCTPPPSQDSAVPNRPFRANPLAAPFLLPFSDCLSLVLGIVLNPRKSIQGRETVSFCQVVGQGPDLAFLWSQVHGHMASPTCYR